jgi:hypothetical protein
MGRRPWNGFLGFSRCRVCLFSLTNDRVERSRNGRMNSGQHHVSLLFFTPCGIPATRHFSKPKNGVAAAATSWRRELYLDYQTRVEFGGPVGYAMDFSVLLSLTCVLSFLFFYFLL